MLWFNVFLPSWSRCRVRDLKNREREKKRRGKGVRGVGRKERRNEGSVRGEDKRGGREGREREEEGREIV